MQGNIESETSKTRLEQKIRQAGRQGKARQHRQHKQGKVGIAWQSMEDKECRHSKTCRQARHAVRGAGKKMHAGMAREGKAGKAW
jgi:hypothetical protein